MISKWVIYGVYWGYKPLTNPLLTSWDIQVGDPQIAGNGSFFLVPYREFL